MVGKSRDVRGDCFWLGILAVLTAVGGPYLSYLLQVPRGVGQVRFAAAPALLRAGET